jgi:membrane-associated phospholipid phosphatase
LHRLWILVTDCGDSAVTLPLALLVLLFLAVARERRLALLWLLAVAGCGAVIGVLKIVFGACTSRLGFLEIVSPSGHTAMSTAIYVSLALLIGTALSAGRRPLVWLVAALLVAAIAVSRIVLHFHDAPEVVVGLAVGLGAAGFFAVRLRREPAPCLPIPWLALGGLAVVVVMHGTRWMIEPAVHDLAWNFRLVLPWCR